MGRFSSYSILGEPVTLDLVVELNQKVCTCLGPRFAKAVLLEEEIDAEVGLIYGCVIGNGEPANS